MKPGKFTEFVKPFIEKLAFSDDIRQILHVKKCIFVYLIRQTDLGIEYQEKYNAWKSVSYQYFFLLTKCKLCELGDKPVILYNIILILICWMLYLLITIPLVNYSM